MNLVLCYHLGFLALLIPGPDATRRSERDACAPSRSSAGRRVYETPCNWHTQQKGTDGKSGFSLFSPQI